MTVPNICLLISLFRKTNIDQPLLNEFRKTYSKYACLPKIASNHLHVYVFDKR